MEIFKLDIQTCGILYGDIIIWNSKAMGIYGWTLGKINKTLPYMMGISHGNIVESNNGYIYIYIYIMDNVNMCNDGIYYE